MKIFLHIGAHKTATTAIQSSFDLGQDKLASLGVIYPRSNWYHHAQHRIAFAMRGMVDPSTRDKPDLGIEISELFHNLPRPGGALKVFLSSEEMFAAGRDSISLLREHLCQWEVNIIAFVRRPDDLLLSIYNQNVKEPRNDFKFPIDKFIDEPFRLHRDMATRECVENWSAAFGRERVLIRRYEDNSPLKEILKILGLPEDALPTAPEANRSVPGAVAEVMRIAKATNMEPEHRFKLYRVANRVFAAEPRLELGSDNRRRILAKMKPEFDALFAEFGMENTYRPDLVDNEFVPPTAHRPVQLLARVVEALLEEN